MAVKVLVTKDGKTPEGNAPDTSLLDLLPKVVQVKAVVGGEVWGIDVEPIRMDNFAEAIDVCAPFLEKFKDVISSKEELQQARSGINLVTVLEFIRAHQEEILVFLSVFTRVDVDNLRKMQLETISELFMSCVECNTAFFTQTLLPMLVQGLQSVSSLIQKQSGQLGSTASSSLSERGTPRQKS